MESKPPFRKSYRRWFTFSLRTLFVGLTLMLLLLGWWVNRAERQRRAVATIKAAGGGVRHLYYGPFCGCCGCWEGEPKSPGLWVLSKFLPKDFYDPIYEVNLRDVEVTPEILRAIALFPHVTELRIERSRLRDRDLECLRSMTGLCELRIDDMAIGETGLRNIGRLKNLRSLRLNQTPATLRNLRLISHMDLGHVHLNFLYATDESLALLGFFKRLDTLDLSHSQVTSAGIAHLAKLTKIDSLHLDNTAIDDEGLAHIAKLPLLNWLDLSNTAVTDRGLEYFASSPSPVFAINVEQTCVSREACRRVQEQLADTSVILHDWVDESETGMQDIKELFPHENSLVETARGEP